MDVDEVKLGDLVKDTVTGYEGIVTSRTEFLNKCVRIGVQAQKLHEGRPVESQMFDIEQVELVEPTAVTTTKKAYTGGPKDFVPSQATVKTRR